MTNSKTEYNEFIRANLPQGITYNSDTNRYVVNEKPWVTFNQSEWYLEYISKFGFSAATPTQELLNALLVDSTQLIAHPLEYGSMFQDRAGTTPVTAPGQLVGHCLDAGGGGYHATAISDAARGVYREEGGIRYIEYNGVNTAYSTPALPAPLVDKAQVFAGVRKLLDVESIIINHVGAFSAVGGLELFAATSTSGNTALYGRSTEGSTGFAGVTIPNRAPVSYVEVGIVDYAQPAGSEFSLRTNGIAQAQNIGLTQENTGLLGTGAIYYGSRGGVSRFFNGRHYDTLGPITRFSAANATTEQIEAAEAYYTARVI